MSVWVPKAVKKMMLAIDSFYDPAKRNLPVLWMFPTHSLDPYVVQIHTTEQALQHQTKSFLTQSHSERLFLEHIRMCSGFLLYKSMLDIRNFCASFSFGDCPLVKSGPVGGLAVKR